MRIVILVVCLVLLGPVFAQDAAPSPAATWFAPPGTYALDSEAVIVTMTVRRFLMSPIRAQFSTVTGGMEVSEAAPGTGALIVEITAADIAANGPFVERMLLGGDFLNAEAHPTIAFAANDFAVSDAPTDLLGELDMAGITHAANFETRLAGYTMDLETGALRLRFVAEGDLARGDWGMSAFRGIVGDQVHIRIEADFVQVVD